MIFEFTGLLWYWRGPAPWYFITVPAQQCDELHALARHVTYGWGMIPLQVQIGESTWTTSLYPKDGSYIVPIKASIRKAEHLTDGDSVTVRLDVRV